MGETPVASPPSAAGMFHASMEKSISTGAKALISSALNREMAKESDVKAARLYDEVFSAAKRLYNADLKREPNFLAEINALTEKALAALTDHSNAVIATCLLDYPNLDEYLYYHITNVFFFSLDMGLELEFDRPHLLDIGAGAFLCDIGIRDLDEHMKEGGLDKREYEKIRQHPNLGVSILTRATKEIGDSILAVVKQAHERLDGSGYPEGLKEDEITEYAQIVGLADVYEALTHKRPYRAKFTPIEALDMILKNKKVFGSKVIKALINRIGVYPVGTLVALNSKETGVVIMNRPEVPFRPVVSIVYDSYGKEFSEPKEIDLLQNPILYIEDCVKEKA